MFGSNEENRSTVLLKDVSFLQYEPRIFTGLKNISVESLACNNNVAMLLSQDGTLYSYGSDLSNKFGILGLGETYIQSNPCPISSLLDHRIQQVALSNSHAAAINSVGHLFTWGTSSQGQLGLLTAKTKKIVEKTTVPVMVESVKVLNIKQVQCSNYTTAFLTSKIPMQPT